MVKLQELERYMKPQFVWDRSGQKILQTSEEYEGAKDLGRMIFVGVADMLGFESSYVMDYLDMEYDSHRNKIQTFRAQYKKALARVENETIYHIEEPIKRFYLKTHLTLNAIKWGEGSNPYVKIQDWVNYE